MVIMTGSHANWSSAERGSVASIVRDFATLSTSSQTVGPSSRQDETRAANCSHVSNTVEKVAPASFSQHPVSTGSLINGAHEKRRRAVRAVKIRILSLAETNKTTRRSRQARSPAKWAWHGTALRKKLSYDMFRVVYLDKLRLQGEPLPSNKPPVF